MPKACQTNTVCQDKLLMHHAEYHHSHMYRTCVFVSIEQLNVCLFHSFIREYNIPCSATLQKINLSK